MSSQPIFYKNIIPLNKEAHGEWSVESVSNYKHTSDKNSVHIAAIEFVKAAQGSTRQHKAAQGSTRKQINIRLYLE